MNDFKRVLKLLDMLFEKRTKVLHSAMKNVGIIAK